MSTRTLHQNAERARHFQRTFICPYRIPGGAQAIGGAPSEGPKGAGAIGSGVEGMQGQQTSPPATQTAGPVPVPIPTGAAVPVPPQPAQQEELEAEDFGGGRISEIIRKFQAKGAISPETALTAEELGLSRLFVRIMKRRKGRTRIFIEINGRYYLDQKALQEMK